MKNDPVKSEKTGVRIRPLLKDLIPAALRLRGLTSISEYFRLLLVNDFCRLGLMPSMTEDERRDEAQR